MGCAGITEHTCRNYCTICLFFLLAKRQVLTQKLGVGDAFDVEMDMTDLGRRLGVAPLLVVFLEKVILQYVRDGNEQVGIDTLSGKDVIDGTSRAVDSCSKLGDR